MILPVVSPTVTRAKQQITSSFGLSIYTKGIQSNLAIENGLNAHFYLLDDMYTECVEQKKYQNYKFNRFNDVFNLHCISLNQH